MFLLAVQYIPYHDRPAFVARDTGCARARTRTGVRRFARRSRADPDLLPGGVVAPRARNRKTREREEAWGKGGVRERWGCAFKLRYVLSRRACVVRRANVAMHRTPFYCSRIAACACAAATAFLRARAVLVLRATIRAARLEA